MNICDILLDLSATVRRVTDLENDQKQVTDAQDTLTCRQYVLEKENRGLAVGQDELQSVSDKLQEDQGQITSGKDYDNLSITRKVFQGIHHFLIYNDIASLETTAYLNILQDPKCRIIEEKCKSRLRVVFREVLFCVRCWNRIESGMW